MRGFPLGRSVLTALVALLLAASGVARAQRIEVTASETEITVEQ